MEMELTWLAIGAALLMGAGAALMFAFAVKRDYFRDLEETKFQVFWSDMEDRPRFPPPRHPVSQPSPSSTENPTGDA